MNQARNERETEAKVAIITGASSGIGYEVAKRAARKGYRVAVNARREDRLQELAGKIEAAGGTVLVVQGDVGDMAVQRRLVEETVRKFGRIDVLVNNAGLPLPTSFADSPVEELSRQWSTNVTALVTLTRIALPYLQSAHGTIINIGSSISHFPVPGMGNYAPTKIAVAGLSKSLRRELEPMGVHLCLVEPGPIDTEFGAHSNLDAVYSKAGGFSLSLPVAQAAIPIVRLFDHPRKRIIVPGWMTPFVLLAGGIMQVASPVVDVVYNVMGRQSR